MASFYNLQRVRMVWTNNPEFRPLVGREATILGPFVVEEHPDDFYAVLVDGAGEWICSGDCMEPIRYLPDAADLETQAIENAPLCPVPVAA